MSVLQQLLVAAAIAFGIYLFTQRAQPSSTPPREALGDVTLPEAPTQTKRNKRIRHRKKKKKKGKGEEEEEIEEEGEEEKVGQKERSKEGKTQQKRVSKEEEEQPSPKSSPNRPLSQVQSPPAPRSHLDPVEWPAPQSEDPAPSPQKTECNFKEGNDMLSEEEEEEGPRVMRIGAPKHEKKRPGKQRAVVGPGGWSTVRTLSTSERTTTPRPTGPPEDEDGLTKRQRQNRRKAELLKEERAQAAAEQEARLQRHRLAQVKNMYG
ncbi:MAG: hypothetical protein DHS80DRAFT_29413 [Piptocephalis tieghemiana]|nr:MAG: hypothetical protein DHS80DRAFT_29413 [Piptocephalis tieghemiana]